MTDESLGSAFRELCKAAGAPCPEAVLRVARQKIDEVSFAGQELESRTCCACGSKYTYDQFCKHMDGHGWTCGYIANTFHRRDIPQYREREKVTWTRFRKCRTCPSCDELRRLKGALGWNRRESNLYHHMAAAAAIASSMAQTKGAP